MPSPRRRVVGVPMRMFEDAQRQPLGPAVTTKADRLGEYSKCVFMQRDQTTLAIFLPSSMEHPYNISVGTMVVP